MRYLIAFFLSAFSIILHAQENNPLINSGELITRGISLHDEGKYKESIELYKKITRGDTNYYRAIYEMAYSQMLDSQYTAAKQSCETGLAIPNESWPELFTLYGNLIDELGDPARALRVFDSAAKLYPAYADIYLNKGTTLIKLNRYADAEEVFKQCVLINPYQGSAHYKLGICAMEQGRVVQAFLSHIYYLLLQPAGKYQSNCITSLSNISKAGDEAKQAIQKRQEDLSDNFSTIERIILSKIALDKQYKPLLKLDDVISRQIQVLCEKMEYDEKDTDFWMQYYVPFYKKIFNDKKFEPFINRLFANIKIEVIQDYVKKNKKEIDEVVTEVAAYCEQLAATRELNFAARKDMNVLYHREDGKLYGKGSTKDKGETLFGDWEFYYSPGNLRSKGNYNEKGEKNGPWQYYHFNGQLRGKQNFKNNNLEGEEIFYYDNGALSTSATFKNGEEDGESKSYYRIGTTRSATHYKSGKMNGEKKSFYSNGNLQAIENYKEDSLDGAFKTYFISGQLESQGSYDNGKIEGLYKVYHENGQLSMEGTYSDGKLKGPWKLYHENGKLKISETFEDGLVNGEYTEYYDNAQLFYKCDYKKGKVAGDVEYFDRDGKRFFIYTYENDLVKAAKYYDKTGKEIGQSQRKSKKLDLTTYFADGTKRSLITYNDKGEITGAEKYFYRSGKPSSENMYVDGELEGPGFNYHSNGKTHVSTFYKGGEKHGYEKYWYSHGQLQQEGWYQDGMMQGTWLSYDEVGNRTYATEYLNDNLNGYKVEYYPSGKKNNETKYKLGWIEEFVQFDTMGREINRCELKNGSGKFKVVFFNGKTYGEGNYVNSEVDGPYKFYFFDGSVNTLQFYKKGVFDSTYTSYYYGGQVASEGRYKAGKKVGLWKTYLANGKLSYTENYVDGELHGKKIFYFEDGKIDSEIEMEKGERNGLSKKFDPDGSLMYQLRFVDELPVAYTYHDKSGKLLPEIPIPAGTGEVKTFYSNGAVSSEFRYVDGKLNGDNVAYYANGKLRSRGIEDYSLTEGKYKSYYPAGQLKYDFVYLHDNLHGDYKEYNEKGIVTEEGSYYNGEPHGITKIYEDSGKLKETRYFYYGKLLDIKK